MVADTGTWLPGRKVLIPPFALGTPQWASNTFPVLLTRDQIESSPELDMDAPVSRLYEKSYYKHFGWSYHWVSMYPGAGLLPAGIRQDNNSDDEVTERDIANTSLRSVNEVRGYQIEATDGSIGHVEDFILDDEFWTIRYMVVDTRDWLPGRKVLVAPGWIYIKKAPFV